VRPVNLIPPEDRRGDRAQLRTGPLPYVIVGVLAIALVVVTFMTMTSNQIADREAQIAGLEAREAAATARAEALRPYADFAALSQARDATVTSLAQSRFDWERVLNELALVMPDDIWLTAATGTVGPDVQLQGATTVDGRDSVPGPALELIGCGSTHESVAAFIAALKDIDGVTRVGLAASQRNEATSSTSAEGSAVQSGASDDCRTEDPIARFEMIVAFDAVPPPPSAETAPAPATPAPGTPAPGTTTPSTGTPASTPADGGSGGTSEQQASRNSAGQQTNEARQAANLVPGVAR
jgi:Tfp pilus assembly protein PilN